jgi:CHASE2 domain-containing sensor protein
MSMDYFRRFSRTTTTEQAGPPPSVWFALKAFFSRFWHQSFKKAILPLVLVTGSVFVIEYFGWFKHIEGAIVDAFSRGSTHKIPTDILIVEITDDDYKRFFGQRSPLNPNVVIELIKSVQQQLQPKVIGVDLDTQDASWTKAKLDGLDLPRIVWAGVPKDAEENPSGPSKPELLPLTPILGRDVSSKQQHVGVVRFPISPDGFVRTFRCFYAIATKNSPSEPMPAFFHLVAHEGASNLPDHDVGEQEGENPYLNFSGNRYNFQKVQASEFIEIVSKAKKDSLVSPLRPGTDAQNDAGVDQEVAGNAVLAGPGQKAADAGSQKDAVPAKQTLQVQPCQCRPKKINIGPKEILRSSFKPSIVLIGGTYGMARDEYLTPLGKMAGVELLANAIETEINRGIGALSPWALILLDLVMGTLIVLIYFLLPGKPLAAMLSSILVAFAVPLLIGLISFYGLTVFLNFAPIMLGMVVHQMYEGTKEAVKLQGEIEEKERVIEKLQSALQTARQRIGDQQVSDPEAIADVVPSGPGSILRTTVVETGTEELHVHGVKEPPQRRRGHAAGS